MPARYPVLHQVVKLKVVGHRDDAVTRTVVVSASHAVLPHVLACYPLLRQVVKLKVMGHRDGAVTHPMTVLLSEP